MIWIKKGSICMIIHAGECRQQQQINFALHQVKREHSQGITLGRTIPVNPLTPYGAQKGILPATGPDTAGLNDSINLAPLNGWPLDASNCQQQLQILKSQPEISAQGLSHMPRNLTPTFPGSSAKFNYRNPKLPKIEINGNNRQMMIQQMQTEEQQNQHNMLQQQHCSFIMIHDTVESFLSHDDDNVDSTSTPFSVLRHRYNPSNEIEQKGFTFGEVSCLHSSKSKVLCCHFSSDGKFLAGAGHEKKVLIWNMETLDFVRTSEGHSHLITEPSKSLCKLVGHAEQVLSLDFHLRKLDLLCSCDSNNEMRLWNVNQRSCMHVSKGATKQVRFQPQLGKLIATVSGNVVNIIDFETDKPPGHNKEVLSICWDPSGNYIASISEDSARLWSMIDGECIHELCSTGNKFQSCTFHPVYSLLLVIGGYQVKRVNCSMEHGPMHPPVSQKIHWQPDLPVRHFNYTPRVQNFHGDGALLNRKSTPTFVSALLEKDRDGPHSKKACEALDAKPERDDQVQKVKFDEYIKSQESRWSTFQKKLADFLSSAVYLFLAYPLRYAQTCMATDVKTTGWQFNGTLDVCIKTWKVDGIAGMFRGYTMALAQLGVEKVLSPLLTPWRHSLYLQTRVSESFGQ
ncbi:LisH dimerization motif,WD40/YVTN repeat-like-containing domain [Theobroma cacao]|uniref:LisH dimerization motif,WD40/YVTN repeat-like-containing domain n=1 Tax=Theobroma cacao TaxID=3641 RepID=A0A061GHB4_THECC|nr:LisH dimerization motif,WD40/YVTN repeat-like-containing domain [Theobroma cacao]